MPISTLWTILEALHVATLALAAWVALRGSDLAAGVVLRLGLALLLATAGLNLVDAFPAAPVPSLVVLLAGVVLAWREARAFPLRLRRVAAEPSPVIAFDDFCRRAA